MQGMVIDNEEAQLSQEWVMQDSAKYCCMHWPQR